MKRPVVVAGFMLVIFPAILLLSMRFLILPGEGYPTWEAVRNVLVQDGEIVIALPDEVKLLAVRCDDPRGSVSTDGQIVTTKIGYSGCTILLDVETRGQGETLRFRPKKLNDWNRIRFEPINPGDSFSNYLKIENGVWKSHKDFQRQASG